MNDANHNQAPSSRRGSSTLAIDVGGTGLKASVLDDAGRMLAKRVRVATPYPCHPDILLDALADLTAPLPPSERISIGFPGVISWWPRCYGAAFRYPNVARLSA